MNSLNSGLSVSMSSIEMWKMLMTTPPSLSLSPAYKLNKKNLTEVSWHLVQLDRGWAGPGKTPGKQRE